MCSDCWNWPVINPRKPEVSDKTCKVLFLCTHHSACSIRLELLVNLPEESLERTALERTARDMVQNVFTISAG